MIRMNLSRKQIPKQTSAESKSETRVHVDAFPFQDQREASRNGDARVDTRAYDTDFTAHAYDTDSDVRA